MDNVNNTSVSAFNRPSNMTDLCDDVLLEIFSYLNLFDGLIAIPSTCKRFRNLIGQNKFPAKAMASKEIETLPMRRNYDRVFEKVVKDCHLKLQLGDNLPDPAKINQLTTMVSEKIDVQVHSDFGSPGWFFSISRIIELDYLDQIKNLTLFTMPCYHVTIHGVEKVFSTKISYKKMFCNCQHYVPLTMNNLNEILNGYRSSGSAPASKEIRYVPGTSLSMQFEFDDYEDRHKYFECFQLKFPFCECTRVAVEILFQ